MSEAAKKPEGQAQPAKPKKSLLYTIGRPFGTFLLSTFLPVKYHHQERLALDPPYILISNHTSMMDPVVLGVGVKKHQIRFVGKKELCSNRLLAALFRSLRMIPVDRHNSDMAAMRACMSVTREGGILGIFPEGTRHHQGLMEEMEAGIGLIALRSKAPLVPVYIAGKLGLFRRLHVYVGEPIPMDDIRAQGVNSETCGMLMKRITETYVTLSAAHTRA